MDNINPYSTPKTSSKDLPESNVRYAGLWLRTVAALFDGFVIFLGIFVLLFLGLKLTGIIISKTALALLLSWLYYTLLESSSWQATLGKKGVGIKVTDMQGEKIGFGRANARYWLKILSGAIFMPLYLIVAFNGRKQGLHDWIAKTLVVRKD